MPQQLAGHVLLNDGSRLQWENLSSGSDAHPSGREAGLLLIPRWRGDFPQMNRSIIFIKPRGCRAIESKKGRHFHPERRGRLQSTRADFSARRRCSIACTKLMPWLRRSLSSKSSSRLVTHVMLEHALYSSSKQPSTGSSFLHLLAEYMDCIRGCLFSRISCKKPDGQPCYFG
jgi:hypothetical protein